MENKKYYGEVWSDDNLNKCFCVLNFVDGYPRIETNLITEDFYITKYIYGHFNNLGYVTFLESEIVVVETGLIAFRVYEPLYVFYSEFEIIIPEKIYYENFLVENQEIVDWMDKYNYYNLDEKKLISQDDIIDEFKIGEDFKLSIINTLNSKSNRYSVSLSNSGLLNFKFNQPISFQKVLEVYKKFQQLKCILSGGLKQFKSFSLKLSDRNYLGVYFSDKSTNTSGYSFLRLRYDEIKDSLPILFEKLYLSTDFNFCINKLYDNFRYHDEDLPVFGQL